MSVRELHGWAPTTVTVDADGNVLSVSATSPRFTRRDVHLMLASRRAERAPRGSHGHLLVEATDPALQNAWVVDLPTTDFAAAKLKKAQDQYAKSYPDADMGSVLWRVRREG